MNSEKNTSGNPEPQDSTTEHKPKKRKRLGRWLRRCLFLFLFLGLLIVLAPWILSSTPARHMIVGYANDQLQGRIDIERIDLSWTSPCYLEGVQLWDRDNEEVLSVERVEIAEGIWELAKDRKRFGTARVEGVKVLLRSDSQGRTSLAQALQPRRKGKARRDVAQLPVGSVEVLDATVTLKDDQGRQFDVSDIASRVQLEQAGKVDAEFSCSFPTGGKITGQANFDDIQLPHKEKGLVLTGKAQILTTEAVQLKPLLSFFAAREDVDGQASMKLDLHVKDEVYRAELSAEARQLHSVGQARTLNPVDLALKALLEGDRETAKAEFHVGGQAGRMDGQMVLKPQKAELKQSGGEIIEAIVAGESVSLPEFTLEVSGKLDLPRLAQAVPSALELLEGVDVTGGQVTIEQVKVQGGPSPTLDAKIEVRNLAAQSKGASVVCQPIQMEMQASLAGANGAEIRQGRILSEFFTTNVSGNVTELNGKFHADLKRLQATVGKMVDLDDLPSHGTLDGSFGLNRRKSDKIEVVWDVRGKDIDKRMEERLISVRDVRLEGTGELWLKEKKISRIESRGSIEYDRKPLGTVKGWADVERQTFQAEIRADQADLATIQSLAQTAGVKLGEGQNILGKVVIQVDVKRAEKGAPIESTGQVSATQLRYGQQPYAQGTASMRWENLRFNPETRELSVRSLRLDNAALQARANRFVGNLGERLRLSGNVELSGDLGMIRDALSPFMDVSRDPLQGRFNWSGNAQASRKGFDVRGKGRLQNLEYGSGADRFSEPWIDLTTNLVLEHDPQIIRIEEARLNSSSLTVSADGTLRGKGDSLTVDVSGRYRGDWQRLMQILKQRKPDLAKDVALEGTSEGSFAVKGLLRQPQTQPTFRGLTASTEFGWNGGRAFGLQLGQARIPLRLSDGQLRITDTTMTASGGAIRIGGTVDCQPKTPVYVLPGEVKVVDRIVITKEVSRDLLSRFNPIFAQATTIDGKVSLTTRQLKIPVSRKKAEEAQAVGSGYLDLTELRMVPQGILATLLQFGAMQTDKPVTVKASGVDFRIWQDRIHYDNFQLVFSDVFDLKFYGAVGFDDSLDMAVSVPVSASLLQRLGVRGSVVDYARVLSGVRVAIPILGTRKAPRLDLARVNAGQLIQQATQKLLLERITDEVTPKPTVRPETDNDQKKTPSTGPDMPKKRKKKPEEEILERVLDILITPDSSGGKKD